MRLIIAEKVSVSHSIASALGATQKLNGYSEGNGYLVSHCAGHLLGLAPPEVYNRLYSKWRRTYLPIIPEDWKYSATESKSAQLSILIDLMNRSDVECIVNACDAGREGELIFRLVYEHAQCSKPVLRLWISSIEWSCQY